MDLENIKDALEEALVHYDFSPAQFCRVTGVNGTLVSHILNGKRKEVSTRHLRMMLPWLEKRAQ